ncbi:MAG: ABC transporter permease subunit [Synechococcales cyanobacterium RM1_1_8]|nr:ABC transporter permease subunit [Synechococcales cyanobacterium RM1_1_8]
MVVPGPSGRPSDSTSGNALGIVPAAQPPLWRDERFWKVFFQVVAVIVVASVLAIALTNMNRNLALQGRNFNFAFLTQVAGFNIGESILPFTRSDSYLYAFFVGFVNTLRLIFVAIPFATILGLVAGIASFSSNWLLRKLSLLYVEVMRNIPILLVLFIWYFVVFFGITGTEDLTQASPLLLLSKKGIWIPWPAPTAMAWASFALLGGGAIAAFLISRWRTKIMTEQGDPGKNQLYMLLGLGVAGLLIFFFGLGWRFPGGPDSNSVTGGLKASLEYSAMLMALAAHTGAFIAEVVRAGIQSVSKGQWEASRASGLSQMQTMQLVVIPQALRVIVPSLNSQYITLNKNSSLALAIGYPEIFSVSQTTLNQAGRAVEILLLLTVTFLLLNLITSFIMNRINAAVQFTER